MMSISKKLLTIEIKQFEAITQQKAKKQGKEFSQLVIKELAQSIQDTRKYRKEQLALYDVEAQVQTFTSEFGLDDFMLD